jgi:hypothetical protein
MLPAVSGIAGSVISPLVLAQPCVHRSCVIAGRASSPNVSCVEKDERREHTSCADFRILLPGNPEVIGQSRGPDQRERGVVGSG